MVQNPEYFFGRSPEHGYVNPDNLFILLNHLKCAAFELPLRDDEKFGALDLQRLCKHLEETGFLHHTKDGWHWLSESYPADALSLRSVSSDNFVIVDNTHAPRVIGETDFTSALTTLHERPSTFRTACSTTLSASTTTTARPTSIRWIPNTLLTPSRTPRSRFLKPLIPQPPEQHARITARFR